MARLADGAFGPAKRFRNAIRVASIDARLVAACGPMGPVSPMATDSDRPEHKMILLSYLYRFVSNFVFLALVYFSLNFLERYPHRAIVSILVLTYATMHVVSALRSFYSSSASSGWKSRRSACRWRRRRDRVRPPHASRSSATSRRSVMPARSSRISTCCSSRSSSCCASPRS